jgi:hypothetical protein
VGWGRGEDEEMGAILKVREALGIFYFKKEIKLVWWASFAGLECALSPLPSPWKGEGSFSAQGTVANSICYSNSYNPD